VTARPYRIVCIGGGTGLPVLLSGFRQYRAQQLPGWECLDVSAVTAIVAFSDDGGSSGRLIREFDTLPPGDLRNCLLALADPAVVPLMRQFFDHRFEESKGGTLAGHSAGNLLIVALTQLHEGDVRKAILDAGRLLGIEGKIVFPTLAPAVLCAQLADGTVVVGESKIPLRDNPSPIARVFLARRGDPDPRPESPPPLPAMPEAVKAILDADAIVLGPGSLYSSVIANLLVPEIAEATRRAKGLKVYVANLMVEPGETDDFSVARHLQAIREHGQIEVDVVIANCERVDPTYARLYAAERLQRELDILQRSLEEAVRSGHPPEEAALEQRVARMQSLLHGLSRPEADRSQVVLQREGESLGAVRVVEIPAVREVQIRQGGATKRVLRHDAEQVIRTLLSLLEGRGTAGSEPWSPPSRPRNRHV